MVHSILLFGYFLEQPTLALRIRIIKRIIVSIIIGTGEKNMKKQHIMYFILLIFLFAGSMTQREAFAVDQPMVWKGSVSRQIEPFIKVVETQEEWSDLWKRALGEPSPAVNFNQYVVACVFLGHSADWLYSIHMDNPVLRGDTWVINYSLIEIILELSGPFKAGGQYAMKVFEKKTGAKMILEEDRRFSGIR